jgi:hypothetical protein
LPTKLARWIRLLVLFVGLWILLSSVQFGESSVTTWFSDIGEDGVDPGRYQVVLESYIHMYLVLGGILFGVGLFYVLRDLKKWIDGMIHYYQKYIKQ